MLQRQCSYEYSVVYVKTISLSSALVEGTMTGNKKIMCKVCCREMRSDHLIRHMKQHSSALQSTEQICKDIVLELVDKVVDMQSAPTTKRKFEDNDSDEA